MASPPICPFASSGAYLAVVVKDRVTPKWFSLVSGNLD